MPTATKKRSKVKAPAVTVTLAQFDTVEPFAITRDDADIQSFTPLTLADYSPRGGTPLLDATMSFIAHLDTLVQDDKVVIGALLDRSGSMGGMEQSVVSGVNEFVGGMAAVDSVDPAAAGTVLAVIVTDGYENSSHEVDGETVAKAIAEREARGWTFIYLGANQDAWAVGRQTGFSGTASGQTVGYTSSPKGMTNALRSVTLDSAGYIGDHGSYLSSRSDTSNRTVTEDGSEIVNEKAPVVPPSPAPVPITPPRDKGKYDVEAALDKARKATSK